MKLLEKFCLTKHTRIIAGWWSFVQGTTETVTQASTQPSANTSCTVILPASLQLF